MIATIDDIFFVDGYMNTKTHKKSTLLTIEKQYSFVLLNHMTMIIFIGQCLCVVSRLWQGIVFQSSREGHRTDLLQRSRLLSIHLQKHTLVAQGMNDCGFL
jgi:uncharacterized membrane protein YagU involved in acid resistance